MNKPYTVPASHMERYLRLPDPKRSEYIQEKITEGKEKEVHQLIKELWAGNHKLEARQADGYYRQHYPTHKRV